MMSIGTLMAYSIVAACVMLLRYEVSDENGNTPNSKPTTNTILHNLWNTDGIRVPTKLSAAIVTIEVTIFCKFATALCVSLRLSLHALISLLRCFIRFYQCIICTYD